MRGSDLYLEHCLQSGDLLRAAGAVHETERAGGGMFLRQRSTRHEEGWSGCGT